MDIGEELKTYLLVIWRFKWMIAALAAVTTVMVLIISLILPPVYKTTATVRVSSATLGAVDYSYLSSVNRLSNTYVEIATSDLILDEVAKRLGLVEQPDVQVDIVPETELIEIRASSSDPSLSTDIANTLAGIMVEESTQLFGGDAPSAREILEEQLKQAKIDLDSAISEYENALRKTTGSTPQATNSSDSNPDVESLSHLVYIRQQLFTDLLQRYENARTSEQLRANAITVVEPANPPAKPSSPNIPIYSILGFLTGLIAGIILAFILEVLDDTVRGVADVQKISKLPILCMIPDLKRNVTSTSLLSNFQSGRYFPHPAIDQLQARMVLSQTEEKTQKVLFTSPEPGVGKSTIIADLALSLTEGGNRVLLIDMDFHRPRLHTIMGINNDIGISNFLKGEAKLNDTIQKTTLPHLQVITAGSYRDVPFGLLTPQKISDFLEKVSKTYKYLLIDAPALLSLADPILFASKADAVIMVIAQRKTERRNMDIAINQLQELNSNLVGIVLNRVSNTQPYDYYRPHSSTHTSFLARINIPGLYKKLMKRKSTQKPEDRSAS